jgi:hypothetical protein
MPAPPSTSRETPRAKRTVFVLLLCLFAVDAYFVAPFSYGDKTVLVGPGLELDAIQHAMLLTDGMDKLLTHPLSYYDTAILYPDRHQMRTLEPFIGFVFLGLPLRMIPGLDDVDILDTVRWAIVVVCLVYAYLLFRALGVGTALAVAGAMAGMAQPPLINSVERLQILCIPLVLPVMYYAVMVWRFGRVRDRVGLFIFAAMYPLCGMINTTLMAMAAVFALPLLARMLAVQQREGRLAAFVVPIAAAAAVDALILAPWLLDRSDLAGYVSDAFLQIKHWNVARGPGTLSAIPTYFRDALGFGVTAALVGAWAVAARGSRRLTHAYFFVLCAIALAVPVSGGYAAGRTLRPALHVMFHIACALTLVAYLWAQVRLEVATDEDGMRRYIGLLSVGLGVWMCLMAFGPVYASNNSPLANYVMNLMLHVVPPLKSIREFDRILIVGIVFLSVYAVISLDSALRSRGRVTRAVVTSAVAAGALVSIFSRPLVATSRIETPKNLQYLAAHSRGTGGIYVHPLMEWNTHAGVWMMALAHDVKRPIVNGYLGIAPPWFPYAANVLGGFPSAEAVWLLRQWKVGTVVSMLGHVYGEDTAIVSPSFDGGNGVVYEVAPAAAPIPHPSIGACATEQAPVRIDGELSPVHAVEGGSGSSFRVPEGFHPERIEITFRRSIVEPMPESIEVYAVGTGGRIRANRHPSGDWIGSLSADALLHRRAPVVTIAFDANEGTDYEIDFRGSANAPADHLSLCGRWGH